MRLMGMQITNGNAAVDGRDFGFWFLGDVRRWADGRLSNADSGLRQSSAVEMKWGVHSAGETRVSWAPCSDKRTISLLVSGKFLIRFRSPEDRDRIEECRLEKPGDYAVWDTDLEHTWIAEQDAVILTVRWIEPAAAPARGAD